MMQRSLMSSTGKKYFNKNVCLLIHKKTKLVFKFYPNILNFRFRMKQFNWCLWVGARCVFYEVVNSVKDQGEVPSEIGRADLFISQGPR